MREQAQAKYSGEAERDQPFHFTNSSQPFSMSLFVQSTWRPID
jgi:hypothetical protein